MDKVKVNQKHLFNSDGDRVTTYTKIPITKEIKIKRLYTWINGNMDKNYDRELDYGELNTYDIYDDNTDIVIANWNNLPNALPNYIESLGIEIGWSDEHSTCIDCGKYMKTSPDCYGWTPNFIVTECAIICRECIEDNIEIVTDNEFQDSHFINNDESALPHWTTELITKKGFSRYNESDNDESYESGFYPGQTDTPQKIVDSIDNIDNYDRLWIIDGHGQFDLEFSLYLRPINKE